MRRYLPSGAFSGVKPTVYCWRSSSVSLLGRELRHAVEVAERVEVRDDLAFRRLYETIGLATRRGRRRLTYDTRAAIAAGHRVAIELWSIVRPPPGGRLFTRNLPGPQRPATCLSRDRRGADTSGR